MKSLPSLAVFAIALAVAVAPVFVTHAADTATRSTAVQENGAITGTVSNPATENFLEGAKIELPALGLSALTDNTGRFVFTGVPAGMHDVVVSYIGLEASRTQVAVTAAQRTVRAFELTSNFYRLDAFKVTGERASSPASPTRSCRCARSRLR